MTIIIIAAIVLGVSLAILYYVIYHAVKNAQRDGDIGTIKKLLIRKMMKEGFSRHEIVEIVQSKEEEFWIKT